MKKFATISIFLFIFGVGALAMAYGLGSKTEENIREHITDSFSIQQKAQESMGTVGEIGTDGVSNTGVLPNPKKFLTSWNFNELEGLSNPVPQKKRSDFYKESPLPDGTLLREYRISAEDREIEIAPGVFFPAWTYNGQVPGPTIRATEGDTIKIYFKNKGTHPHTMHFHGIHSSEMDGAMTEFFVLPGEDFTYEFKAEPFGLHLYHCHTFPLTKHIGRGLYGAYIVDPKHDTRPKPDKELIMVMNGFDTNFDDENEVYAVNTVAFYYEKNPIKVKKDELVRLYVVNTLEVDQLNSFHLHANFFDEYRTGTRLTPDNFTDTLIFGQGERSILDVRFKNPGMFMFHAHKTEFAEKGWSGFFEVTP